MAEEENSAPSKSTPPPAAKGKGRGRPAKDAAPIEEDPDALMTVTLRAMEWAQKRRAQILYSFAGLIAASGAFFGYAYYQANKEEKATAIIAKGVSAELAPLRTGDEDPEIARRLKFYASEAEKQQEAAAAYAEVRARFDGTGAGILARLGEAGLFLDKRDWDQAIAAYNDVKATGLAAADTSIRMRCLEGLGYAKEGKAQLDDARGAFNELANLDAKGAKALGLYHLARIDVAKGDKSAALEKLKTASDAIDAPGAPSSRYLKDQVDKLHARLDPTFAPKPVAPPGGAAGMPGMPGLPQGAGPGGKLTKEQIDAFLKSMGTNMPGGAPPAPLPPPPGGAPPAPAPLPPPPPAPPAPAGSP